MLKKMTNRAAVSGGRIGSIERQRGLSLIGLFLVGILVVGLIALGFKSSRRCRIHRDRARSAEDQERRLDRARAAGRFRPPCDDRRHYVDYSRDLDITKEGDRIVISYAYAKKVPITDNVSLVIDFSGTTRDRQRRDVP